MKTVLSVVLALAFVPLSACAPRVNDPADVQAVKQTMEAYTKGIVAKDAPASVAMMTDNTAYFETHIPAMTGRVAVPARVGDALGLAQVAIGRQHLSDFQEADRSGHGLRRAPPGRAGIPLRRGRSARLKVRVCGQGWFGAETFLLARRLERVLPELAIGVVVQLTQNRAPATWEPTFASQVPEPQVQESPSGVSRALPAR